MSSTSTLNTPTSPTRIGDTRDAPIRCAAKEVWLKPLQRKQTMDQDPGWNRKETPDKGSTPNQWSEQMGGSDKDMGH